MRTPHAIFLALLSAGCVPLPHVEHDSPELEGRLLRDGNPAADVRVALVTTTRDCRAEARAETRTDALGRFSLERTAHWELFVTAGEQISTWSLCFEYPDGARTHWWGTKFGWPPSHEELLCDLQPGDPRLGTVDEEQARDSGAVAPTATHSHGCLVVSARN